VQLINYKKLQEGTRLEQAGVMKRFRQFETKQIESLVTADAGQN